MKKLLLSAAVAAATFATAQTGNVGINTTTPATTLDVTGVPTDATKLDGITAPRLTGDQLRAKTYTTAQTGALVYATVADSAPAGQTVKVTTPGYYYFDGSIWQHVVTSTPAETDPLSWHLTGNSITEGNFLGTTNLSNLVFKQAGFVVGMFNQQNMMLGHQALFPSFPGFENGYGNYGIGYSNFWQTNSGNNNLFFGQASLYNNTTGGLNIAIGNTSLSSNTTGSNNLAIGTQSQYNTTTGNNNVSIGVTALFTNSTGSDNVAIGRTALGKSVSANSNVAIGSQTFALLGGTGARNTAVGMNAGYNLNGGDNNIFIGSNTYANISTTGSNQLNIGNVIFGYNYKIGIGDKYNGTYDFTTTVLTPGRTPVERLEVDGNISLVTPQSVPAGNSCPNLGTISFGTDGNFYGCTGTASPGVWKQLNN